jgi:CelD/BcsL family acetyltransferase involved in cellulose biosynthesis
VQVSVVAPADLGPVELSAWRELQSTSQLGSPFLSPTFAQAVGRARDDARVTVVSDHSGLAGFFAFQLDDDGSGSAIGAGLCDAQAFVCRADLEWDAKWLLRASGLSCWRFDHLRVDQQPFAPYHRALHRSPVIDLQEGYDAFVARVRQRSRDVVPQMARRRRKLEREVGPVVTRWDDDASDAMETLKRWKSAQYAATDVWDRFGHPWINALLDDLRLSDSPECRAVVATSRAGDQLAAVHLGLVGPEGLSWWFPAYEPALGSYSPGLLLLLDLAEAAAARSLSMIDLGRGEHGYKMRVATDSYDVAEGEVSAG